MAVDHTSGVRLETWNTSIGSPGICKIQGMSSIKNTFLIFSTQKDLPFTLHSHKIIDINPIAGIDVSAASQRHCSTTFYP